MTHLTKEELIAAYALVEKLEIHAHGMLLGQPLYGINPHVAMKTVIKSLETLIDAKTAPTPEGWKLVPIEPTEYMYQKGIDATYGEGHEGMKDVYRAMLAAAPTPPEKSEWPI